MDLLILCCFGGVPFIEFPSSPSSSLADSLPRHQWDPTDWVATDMSPDSFFTINSSSSSSSSSSLSSRLLIPTDFPSSLSLDLCDLWNLTFASGADEHLFRRQRGKLKCRCLPEYHGPACQHQGPQPKESLAFSSPSSPPPQLTSPSPSKQIRIQSRRTVTVASGESSVLGNNLPPISMDDIGNGPAGTLSRHENSFAIILLLFMLLVGAMIALFLMLRGCCFCDCFGGFSGRSARRYDQPLDSTTVDRCMDAIRVHEQEEKAKWATHGQWTITQPPPSSNSSTSMVVDSRRPLLPSTVGVEVVVPTVSKSVPMAMAPPLPRACSPPPSYRSLNSSLEQLPYRQA